MTSIPPFIISEFINLFFGTQTKYLYVLFNSFYMQSYEFCCQWEIYF